jgi:hypothetical protein
LQVINDLFVIFGRNPIEILILGKAIKYANYKCWGEGYKYFVEGIGLQYYIKGIINASG